MDALAIPETAQAETFIPFVFIINQVLSFPPPSVSAELTTVLI